MRPCHCSDSIWPSTKHYLEAQIGRISPASAQCISNVFNVGQYEISFEPMLRVFLANNAWLLRTRKNQKSG